jgi:hypothetical protein
MHSTASLACEFNGLVVSGFLLYSLLACLLCLVLDLTYPAKAARAEIVSAGDGAFFQRWDGAGKGGEADYGC